MMKHRLHTLLFLVLLGAAFNVAAQASTCSEAWDAYNEFKRRNKMEPSQYAVTHYGADVRALCGPNALPVPPGTDTPRIVVRKPPPPKPPPKPPAPPKN